MRRVPIGDATDTPLSEQTDRQTDRQTDGHFHSYICVASYDRPQIKIILSASEAHKTFLLR